MLTRHLSRDAWVRTRYYTEWAKPRGVCDSIQTMVLREPRRIGIFAANRHETVGPVSDREVAILRLLAPHIRRAVTIGDLMDLKKVEVQALGSTLDHLAAGVIVVGEGNRVLHANDSARRMFATGSPVRSLNGRLAARGTRAGAELTKAIDLARRNESGIGSAPSKLLSSLNCVSSKVGVRFCTVRLTNLRPSLLWCLTACFTVSRGCRLNNERTASW